MLGSLSDFEKYWTELNGLKKDPGGKRKKEIYDLFPRDLAAFRLLESYAPDYHGVEDWDNLSIGAQQIAFKLVRDYMARHADEEFVLACLKSDRIYLAYACGIGINQAPKSKLYSEVIRAQVVANAVARLEHFDSDRSLIVPNTTTMSYVATLARYGTEDELDLLERIHRVEARTDDKYPLPVQIRKAMEVIKTRAES